MSVFSREISVNTREKSVNAHASRHKCTLSSSSEHKPGESFFGTSAEITFQHRNRRILKFLPKTYKSRQFSILPKWGFHGLCIFVTNAESG